MSEEKSMRQSWVSSGLRFLAVALPLAMPVASLAQAGQIDLPSFDELARKATNSVNISLNPALLQLAAQYIGNDNGGADVQAAVNGLKGIYVRSFQFATDHAYSASDVQRVRQQLAGPGWMKLVSVHSSQNDQDVDIYMLEHDKSIEGLVIIAAQPRKLTIVNLVGSVDLAKLRQLQGKFGVPVLPVVPKAGGS
jgi:Domain of unknown function (DUF4252)